MNGPWNSVLALSSYLPGLMPIRMTPLGGLLLTEDSYAEMTRIVLDIADKCCKGRVLSALEGGYNLDALALSVLAHLGVMTARATDS